MANIFKAKTLVGRTGIFSHEVIAPNLVYNTGNQIIYGDKSFYSDTKTLVSGNFQIIPTYNLSGDPESLVDINSKNLFIDSENIAFADDITTGLKKIGSYIPGPNISLYDFDPDSVLAAPSFDVYSSKFENGTEKVSSYGNNISLKSGSVRVFNDGEISLRYGKISWNPTFGLITIPGVGPAATTNLYPTDAFSLKSDMYAFYVNSGSGFFKELYANNLIYNTGNQTIYGNKTFANNIEVQGTGIFNSVDLSNISEFQFSGTDIDLIDSNVYVSGAGWIYISGQPVATGSAALSALNLNNIVYTTGSQTIIGLKDFNNIISVSGIQFDVLTTDQTPPYQEGLLYYSDDTKTLNLDTDVNDLALPIGQEIWVRAKNLTNSTITPGTVVYITGAQGNTPLVQRSLATSDGQSARTLGVAAHSINNNSKGYFTTFGIVENINTSAYPVGTTLYLSWETSGAFTGVKPQAPNHIVRIGNVLDQSNNGSIFVTVQNGFEIDELHDVRITNPQNKDGIIYNSASGLWLNTPAALANEVVYITGNQNISGFKTFTTGIDIHNNQSPQSIRIFNITGTNSGEFGLFGWQNNQLIIGATRSQSGILRDILITGNNININGSGVLNIFDNTNILGNLNMTGNFSVSGTGVFNGLNLNSIDELSLSGIDINITRSNINLTGSFLNVTNGNVIISGNPVLTGTSLTQSRLNAFDIVFTTGNQIIDGQKTFSSGIDIVSGNNPRSIRIFNSTGINSGEFALFGWRNNQLIIGTQQSQGGLLRDVILTGRNININASGVLNIIDPVNISGNLNVTGDILLSGTNILNYINSLSSTSSNIVFTTGNQSVGGNKTFTGITTFSGQEVNLIDSALNLSGVGDMTFTSTNINFLSSPVYISGTNLRVDGNILLSGNPVLTGIPDVFWASQAEINSLSANVVFLTGNQNIDGIKTFANRPTINGTGVLLSGEAAQVDLTSTIRTTGNQTVSGIKNFQSPPLVSGKEVYYQKDVYRFTGDNFTPDNNLARTFEYILTGAAGASATLNAPVNMNDGENIVIKIKQSPNGSNNMQFNPVYKFPGSVAPSLTLTASKADIYTILKVGAGFYSTYVKDFID